MLELNKIYNMDCLDGLKKLDDNSIDPSYSIGYKSNGPQFKSAAEHSEIGVLRRES